MLASLIPWFLTLAAWAGALFFHFVKMHAFLESLLFFTVIFNGGIQGLWAAVGHLCFPVATAAKIGWQSNGFQTEIGGTNLALGITSVLCFWNHSWLLPVALIISIYYASCVYIHIKEKVVDKNNAPCNSGPMLYNTILVVMTLWAAILLA